MRWAPSSLRRLLDIDRQVVDAALAAAVFLATVEVGRQYHPDGWRPFDIIADLLCAAILAPLAVRRRAPMTVLLTSCAGFTAYLALGYQPSIAYWGPVLGMYTVAALRPPRAGAVAAALTAGVVGYSGVQSHVFELDVVLAQAALATGVAWAFGVSVRRLAERNGRLAALGEQLRQEQQQREHRAVAEERIRIARELHDVAAHHMAVISVQAGLARYVFSSDPQTALAAMDTVACAARETLEEMRRMLAVLRITGEELTEDAPEQQTAVGLDRLGELLDRVRGAGVPVDLVVTGEPGPLTQGQDQCVYRVVQEALTNVLKHAGPATATVMLRHDAGQLTARISDDGHGAASPVSSSAGGHGLIGMRERARIYGGTLTVGERTGGGFEVSLVLPTAIPSTGSEIRAATY